MNKIFYIFIFFLLLSCKQDKKIFIKEITSIKEKREGIKKYNFYENDKLIKTLQYIDLCGKKYLNQGWYYNDRGDTIDKGSNYFKVSVSENLLKEYDSTKIAFFYKPILKKSILVLLICREDVSNYCEIDKHSQFDTLYFNNDNKLEYYQGFQNIGKTNIMGHIIEVSSELKKVNNHNVYDERKVYFKIPFEVIK